MDAFKLLSDDHRSVESLFARLDAVTGAQTRANLFAELKQALDVHAEIEEEIFYPALLHEELTAGLVRKALDEHGSVKQTLIRMQAMPADDTPFGEALAGLRGEVDAHVAEEERELFPKAERVLSTRLREDLGERMQRRREELLGAQGSAVRQRVEEIESASRQMVAEWADVARQRGRAAVATQTRSLGEQLHGIAGTLRDTADSLGEQGQATLSEYVHDAADGLERTAANLREGNVEELVQRVSGFAQRRPAVFVGGAVAAGFLFTRFLRSSAARRPRSASPPPSASAAVPRETALEARAAAPLPSERH